MFTVDDFLSQYESASDEELLVIHTHPDDYTPEAGEAVRKLIDKRGGLEATLQRIKQKQVISAEINRISAEAKALAAKGVDPAFIQQTGSSSTILSASEVNDVLAAAVVEGHAEAEDRKIKPRTVYGSLLGGILASLIGSILWGGQLIFAGGYIGSKITLLLVIGLTLVCYGIVRAATKQSRKNILVLIATIVSVIISLGIGQLLFDAIKG
jgi:hypothetical protein